MAAAFGPPLGGLADRLVRIAAWATETPARVRALRDWTSIAGIAVLAWFLLSAYGTPGFDAYAYWYANPHAPYHFDGDASQFGAFRYSPAAAQLLSMINWLPWSSFFLLWMVLLVGVLVWIGREWTLALLVAPFVLLDVYMGNIEVLLAAAILVGLRYPAAWAFVLLTKVTPGIGLLWFVVRREWTKLAIALGATAAVVGISFLIAPGLWLEWPRALLGVDSSSYWPFLFPLRLAAAGGLVIWGARRDQPWVLIVAGTLALAWLDPKTLALLVGLGAYLPRTEALSLRVLLGRAAGLSAVLVGRPLLPSEQDPGGHAGVQGDRHEPRLSGDEIEHA